MNSPYYYNILLLVIVEAVKIVDIFVFGLREENIRSFFPQGDCG
jgi:hypothetical protein